MDAHWEHFEHGADIGVRGYGTTPGEAFAQAALAMSAAIAPLETIHQTDAIDFTLRAAGFDYLLVEWLNALIFEMTTRHMLFSRFDVKIHGRSLHATAFGETVDRERHQPAVEPKGATFTELDVRQAAPGRWLAQCIVDV